MKRRKIRAGGLAEILEAYKRWLAGEPGGVCADLSLRDLLGVDVGRADLRGANLWYADLRGTSLENADLRGANLLWHADLRGTRLGGTRRG